MFLEKFPRLLFKEKKLVWSKYELKDKAIEGMKIGKQILISLYSFSEVEDSNVKPENVIIDVLMFTGPESNLRELSKNLNEKRYLIFDGEEYFLLVEKEVELNDLDEIESKYVSFGVKLNKDPMRMIILPNTLNIKTKKYCKVLETYN